MEASTTAPATSESADELIARVARRIRRAGVIATVVGAIDTFTAVGVVLAVVVGQSESNRLGWINGPIVVALVAGSLVIAPRVFESALEPVRRWLRAGGPPGGGELQAALAVPFRLALRSTMLWGLATLGFVILNLIVASPTAALAIGYTMASGAVTWAALFYLLAERAARPLTVRALAAEPAEEAIAPGVKARLLAAWALGTGVPLLMVVVVGIVGVAKSGAHADAVGEAVIFLGAFAIAAGILALMITASSIAAPLGAVRRGMERVEAGELDTRVRVDDASEIGLLEAGFNRMVAGLEERERLRDLFGRHVGRDVAAAALDGKVKLGGEERQIAALFVDVTGSTRLAARLPPSDVVALLNRFFAIVVDVVERSGGLVNKFEGDAAVSVFGAPVASADPAGSALRAARELAARLRSEITELDFGIGVSAGVAVAGNIGAEERFEYTVIGDPVNEAARLCELAKGRVERVLASGRAVEAAEQVEAAGWQVGETARLRGREGETELAVPASVAAGAASMVAPADGG